MNLFENCERPVILLGYGAHGADITPLLSLGVPILTSWQAMDMIDSDHPMYFGRPGQYGQRCANKVLHNADYILAIGNRMSIWNCGYEGPRKDQRVVMVDIDKAEADKFQHAEWVCMLASEFISFELPRSGMPGYGLWVFQCNDWRDKYPWVESPTHDDGPKHIHSHRFVDALHPYLRPDEVIVTDMGAAMIAAHQVLRLKPPQRIMTSGGLGEMGCALPAAIGASFARDKGEVLCLHCDGGMMLNLQELATIAHHKLPIKIIVFENDGYLMIKKTQDTGRLERSGVDKASGVSFPNFWMLAQSFGIQAADVWTWDHFQKAIPALFNSREPGLVVFHMNPNQDLVPKLDPIYTDGKPTSPAFDDLSPRL